MLCRNDWQATRWTLGYVSQPSPVKMSRVRGYGGGRGDLAEVPSFRMAV